MKKTPLENKFMLSKRGTLGHLVDRVHETDLIHFV